MKMLFFIILEKKAVTIMMLNYEIRKILYKRLNRILLIAILLLSVVFSAFAIGSFNYVDQNGVTHQGPTAARSLIADKNRWKGKLTPDVIAKIVDTDHAVSGLSSNTASDKAYGKDIQSYEDIVSSGSLMLNGERSDNTDDYAILSANHSQIKSIYETYVRNLKLNAEEYGKTPKGKEFLLTKYQKIEMPLNYEAPDSWSTMMLYATTFSLILVVIIGFLTAGIFSEEYSCKADAVFFASRCGRNAAVRNKILAGLIIATIVYWIGILLLSAICFTVMGTSGSGTLYQLSYPYSVYVLTHAQVYGVILLCGYVASLLSASITMLTAAKMRSMHLAVCLPFLLFFVSPFIGRALPFTTFFSLTPDQLTNIMNCSRIPYIYQFGEIAFRQIPFITVLYLVIALCLLPFAYNAYRRVAV